MVNNNVNEREKAHPYDRYRGGPHGLGDPEDLHLRKVELDVLIPKKMRHIARTEKCHKEVDEFNKCVLAFNNYSMIYKCRTENNAVWKCLERWYYDDSFKERCKNEYLKERSEYRRTGITKKEMQKLQSSNM